MRRLALAQPVPDNFAAIALLANLFPVTVPTGLLPMKEAKVS
jgi:hypothetical protein